VTALVDRASRLLEQTIDRRNFLGRTALAATAVAVAPLRFLLEPITAQAAICGCAGSSCDCAQRCCDGYTEFCCTITGSNACPPGTLTGGWWKADGSPFCNVNGMPQPRYYIDCNADCQACGCDASGICSPGCVRCGCGCANGNCNNRRACCNLFRYGQCHQNVACVGPILCRVVTCTPPWLSDATCTTALAVDESTAFHDAPCLHAPPPAPPPPPGVHYLKTGRWYLRNELTSGSGDMSVTYGDPRDIPVAGDWNGDGKDTPGVVRGFTWYLRNELTSGGGDISLTYGESGDTPVVGDWNGDGVDGIGVVRNSVWYLRNELVSGNAELSFTYGDPGDIPIVGDWDGDGKDGVGVVRGTTWFLRNELSSGPPEIVLTYGDPDDIPVIGDWDADGRDGIGVFRGNTWYLRNTLVSGESEIQFNFGVPGDIPVAGAWQGGKAGRPGVVR
jgi:hypothetical protein